MTVCCLYRCDKFAVDHGVPFQGHFGRVHLDGGQEQFDLFSGRRVHCGQVDLHQRHLNLLGDAQGGLMGAVAENEQEKKTISGVDQKTYLFEAEADAVIDNLRGEAVDLEQ